MGQESQKSTQRFNRLVMYVGTTCWIAWNVHLVALCPNSSVALPHPQAPWDQAALVVGYVVGALVLLGGSRLFSGSVSLSRTVVFLALICAMTAVLFYAASPLVWWAHSLLLVTLGCLTLIITILWMCVVCVRSSATIYRSMGGTTACGALLALGVSSLEPTGWSMGLLIAIMLASFACFVFASDSTLGSDASLIPRGEDHGNRRSSLVPHAALVAGAVVWGVAGCGVALFASAVAMPVSFGLLASLAGGIMVAALAFLLVGHRLRKADKLGFVVLALMVLALGSGLYMLQALDAFTLEAAVTCMAAGCALFHLYCKVLYLDIAYLAAESPLLVFAQGALANYVGALAGAAAGCLLGPAVAVGGASAPILVLLIVLLTANALFFSRKSMGTRWGLVARQMAMPLPSRPSDLEQFASQAVLVAQEAGLTPREVEVFQLLMEGYRAKQIEEKLGISLGTVRNHLNRGYAKLGVHSYDEARALVSAASEKAQDNQKA